MCNYIVLKMTKEKEDGKYMHIISEVRSKDEKGFHLQEWLVMFTCSLGCSCDTRFITHRDSWCLAAFFPLFIHQNVHTGVNVDVHKKYYPLPASLFTLKVSSRVFDAPAYFFLAFSIKSIHLIKIPYFHWFQFIFRCSDQSGILSVIFFVCEWDTGSCLNSGETEKQDCPRRGDNSLVCWRKVYSTCHESFSPGIWLIYPSPTCGPRCFQPLEMICSERLLSAWSTGANWLGVLTKKGIKISHKTFFQFWFWFIPLFIQFSLACRYLIWDEIHWHKIHHVRDCPVWDVEPDVPEGFVSLFSLR